MQPRKTSKIMFCALAVSGIGVLIATQMGPLVAKPGTDLKPKDAAAQIAELQEKVRSLEDRMLVPEAVLKLSNDSFGRVLLSIPCNVHIDGDIIATQDAVVGGSVFILNSNHVQSGLIVNGGDMEVPNGGILVGHTNREVQGMIRTAVFHNEVDYNDLGVLENWDWLNNRWAP